MSFMEYVEEVRTHVKRLFNENVIVIGMQAPFPSFVISYRDYSVRVAISEVERFYHAIVPTSECARELARIIMKEFGRILLKDEVRSSNYL